MYKALIWTKFNLPIEIRQNSLDVLIAKVQGLISRNQSLIEITGNGLEIYLKVVKEFELISIDKETFNQTRFDY